MAITLNNNDEKLETVFNNINFIYTLESFIPYIKSDRQNFNVYSPTQDQNWKYEGDFYGLLNELRVPYKLHYITMRVNGLENSGDYKGDIPSIVVPLETIISRLVVKYLSTGS
jgi:hypothetical protein